MRNLRRFLTPGWILGVIAAVLFAWVCFALLAPWQLGKSGDLEVRNARITEAIEAAPVPMSELVTAPSDFTDREWRLVTVAGQWQPESEALLRLRSIDGEPVYHVLTVFTAEDGSSYLVNRGYIPVGENNTVPDYSAAPTGEVEITARLRAAEAGQAEPVIVDGMPAVRVVDPGTIGAAVDETVNTDGYLQLISEQPGSLTPAPIPGVEAGPYLSYGLQWLLFGVLAPAALIYFAWAEIRARRRDAETDAHDEALAHSGGRDEVKDKAKTKNDDDDTVAPAGPDSSGHGGVSDVSHDDVAARERAMRARYGTRDDAEKRRAHKRADRLRQ